MADPNAQKIQLNGGGGKDDLAKSGMGTSFVQGIVEDAAKNFADTLKKKDAESKHRKKVGEASSRAGEHVKALSGKILKHFGVDSDDEELDPKDYKLEADEINEMFRATSSQRGGLALQLCIFITVVLFTLVDTVSIQSIHGTTKALSYLTEERYWKHLSDKNNVADAGQEINELIFSTSETLPDDVKESLRDFYKQSEIEFRDPKVMQLDDDYVFGTERAGRVLRFIKNPDDFYDWLRFVLSGIWGPKDIVDNWIGIGGREANGYDVRYTDETICPVQTEENKFFVNYDRSGMFMMDSVYVMGARLTVRNAQGQEIIGNSHFKAIYNETRTHTASYVIAAKQQHFDPEAFTEFVEDSDENNFVEKDEFIGFFRGGMTCEEIEAEFNFIKDNRIVSNDLLKMDFEIMTFSADSRQGSLLKFTFFQSHAGVFYAYLSKNPFQPENNGVTTDETWIRVTLQGSYLICMLFVLFESIKGLRLKCRQLFTYRLNEFSLHDFVQYILLVLGTVILTQGGLLFWSPEYNYLDKFHIPIDSYDDYLTWVKCAQMKESFRAMLGSFIMMQMINLLLTASVILPSLGILFRTIERSMADMFVFTTITLLIYVVFVITVYISFGEQVYQFSSLAEAFLSCFEMFLGDIYYTRMFEADPQVSAVVLILFVLIMNFMVLNMYTAIVIRTYNKLQARQLFLGESMAKIQAKKAKKKITNCLNLLRCRSSFSQNKDEGQGARRNDPDEEDKGANEKLSQICSQNLQRLTRNKVMTKDKFTRELEKAAQQVAKDKQKQKKERLRQIKNANVTESCQKLQKGMLLLAHLIVGFMFYLSWTEAEVHSDIRGTIIQYIQEVDNVGGSKLNIKNMQSTYFEPALTVSQYDLSAIGMNRVVSDTVRLTYRLYKLEENTKNNTNEIFASIKSSKHNFDSRAQSVRPFIMETSQVILSGLSSTVEEEKQYQFSFNDVDEQISYTNGLGGSYESFYDEGGYVVILDASKEKIVKSTKDTSKPVSLFQIAAISSLDEEVIQRQQLGSMAVDWVMYNPNQDIFIYVGLLFRYTTGGDLNPNLNVETFRAKPKQDQFLLLIFFVLFYLYYLVKLLIDLCNTYSDRQNNRDGRNGLLQNPRLNEENERPWYIRFVNFIGIDDQRLQGQNLIVVLVLVIFMVLKKIVQTVLFMIQAIYYYCTAGILNAIEFANIVLLTMIIANFVSLLPILLGDELRDNNPDLLQLVNKVAAEQATTKTWKAYSVFCLCIRVLHLPSFSLIANLPFETLSQGRKDIINIMIILLIFLLSSSMACYIVFCSELLEFSSVVTSIFNTNKIYMGDFSLIGKMFSVSPIFTTFYLFMSMTLYTMFITQMFLGVVVGHFLDEWKRVQQIVSQSNESFRILPVIWRVIKGYYKHRRDEKERSLRRQGIDPATQKCCNCTCRSFHPIGMFERIIVCCMMCCCRKKQDQKGYDGNLNGKNQFDSHRSGDYNDQDSADEYNAQAKQMNASMANAPNGADQLGKSRLPFNKAEQLWGLPTQLKTSEDFFQHTGSRTYLNWFDGWSIEQYAADWDKMEYFSFSKKQKRGFGQDLDSKVPDDEMREMKDRLPQSIEGILNLESIWNDDVDEYEKANSNYWMYHLTKQVNMLTKKEISLYALKAMDCFFTQHLVTKAQEQSTSLQDQLTKEQVTIFFMKTSERDAFFSDPARSVDEKYLAWKAIDLVHRYNMQQTAFDEAGAEKKEYEQEPTNKPNHSNLMTLLITQIERPIEEEMEHNLLDFSVVSKIAQPKNGKNPLKFEAVKAGAWRKKKYHRVFHYLQKVWRELLTNREKYEFWFNYFNTMERVRLWNQLVFTREWFRRVVQFSRKQTNYKKAVAMVEKIQKEESRKAASSKNKANAEANEDEEGSDAEMDQNKKKGQKNFYRGFHRRDLNDMLKYFARKMYKKGVRNEELLIIKIKPDQGKDIVERQHIGGTTSFFNNDVMGNEKAKADTIQQLIALENQTEMRETRKIFTPDQMLKTWNQFLSGTFMLLSEKKQKQDQDQEDGIYSEFKILKLEDEDKYQELRDQVKMKEEEFKNYWVEYKMHDQVRTMDRYEQIHYFFTSIIEHNIKTLGSCEAALREKDKAASEAEQPKSILKNADQGKEEENKDGKKDGKKGAKKEEAEQAATAPQEETLNASQKAKFDLYVSVRDLVISEEERLPLWMLMSKEEKLDMLAHQCIDSEAQIMGLLVEFEYGAENNFKKEGTNLSLDAHLEKSLNQMIFQKYLSYTRLQATFYARKFTKELIEKTQDQSIKLYTYAEYLHDMNKTLRTKEKANNKQIASNLKENTKIETKMREIAHACINGFQGIKDDDKDRAALAMKFLFEVKE